MKILIWTSGYFPTIGGLEIILQSLVGQFRLLHHDVFIISDSGSADFNEIKVDDVTVVLIPFTHALLRYQIKKIKANIEKVAQIL
ncbi:MAG: hypothetical protein NTZ67_08380, partial [Gammaproteobacteria bacterium]|nr:hypothetical protein [Gammaproteobacteria bacterium]